MAIRQASTIPLRMLAKVAPEEVVKALEQQEIDSVNADGDVIVDVAAMRKAVEVLRPDSKERAYAEALMTRMGKTGCAQASSKTGALAGQVEAIAASLKSAAEVVVVNQQLLSPAQDPPLKPARVEAPEPGVTAHSGAITGLLTVGDGFATCSSDDSIKTWQKGATKPQNVLLGHTATVTSLTVLPNQRIASSSDDHTVKVWNTQTGWCEQTLQHKDRVCTVVALDGGYLASHGGGHLYLWKADAKGVYKKVCRFQGAHGDRHEQVVALSGTRFAVVSSSGKLKVLDAAKARFYRIFDRHRGALSQTIDVGRVRDLVVLPGDRLVWSSGTGLFVSDLSKKTTEVIHDQFNPIYSLTALTNNRVALGLSGGVIEIWDLNTKSCVYTDTVHPSTVQNMVQLADGQLVSANSSGNFVVRSVRPKTS